MSAGNCCLPTFSVNNQTACNSYLFNGQWLTTSGVYFDTLINSSGCDSNVTFNLTIGNPTASTINQTTCNSYIFNGQLFTASGIYYDTLINSNGCDSILTLNLTITQIDKTVVKNGFSFWSNQPGGSSYQWINCDNNIPIVGATNQGYTTIAGGSYAVIISYNGCIDTSNCITMIGLGTMSDQTSETSISMLPNPARDRLTVRHSKDGSLIMNIYDLSGRFVYQQTIPLGKMEMNIDISSLNGGHYFVKFIMNGKTVSINKLSVSR